MGLKASPCLSAFLILLVSLSAHVESFESFSSFVVKNTRQFTSQPSNPSSSWFTSVYSSNERKLKLKRNFAFSKLDLKDQNVDAFSSMSVMDFFKKKSNNEKDINKNNNDNKNKKIIEGNVRKKGSSISGQRQVLTSSTTAVGSDKNYDKDSNDDNDDSFIEEWLGEYNNPTFWKGVVVAICKLLKYIFMNECILINIHTHIYIYIYIYVSFVLKIVHCSTYVTLPLIITFIFHMK